MTKLAVKHDTDSTIMAVKRSSLKMFKVLAAQLEMPMTELHDELSKLPVSKLRELLNKE